MKDFWTNFFNFILKIIAVLCVLVVEAILIGIPIGFFTMINKFTSYTDMMSYVDSDWFMDIVFAGIFGIMAALIAILIPIGIIKLLRGDYDEK